MIDKFSLTCQIESWNYQMIGYLQHSNFSDNPFGYSATILGASISTACTLAIGLVEAVLKLAIGILFLPYLISRKEAGEYFEFIGTILHASIHPFINIKHAICKEALDNFAKIYMIKFGINIGMQMIPDARQLLAAQGLDANTLARLTAASVPD